MIKIIGRFYFYLLDNQIPIEYLYNIYIIYIYLFLISSSFLIYN